MTVASRSGSAAAPGSPRTQMPRGSPDTTPSATESVGSSAGTTITRASYVVSFPAPSTAIRWATLAPAAAGVSKVVSCSTTWTVPPAYSSVSVTGSSALAKRVSGAPTGRRAGTST